MRSTETPKPPIRLDDVVNLVAMARDPDLVSQFDEFNAAGWLMPSWETLDEAPDVVRGELFLLDLEHEKRSAAIILREALRTKKIRAFTPPGAAAVSFLASSTWVYADDDSILAGRISQKLIDGTAPGSVFSEAITLDPDTFEAWFSAEFGKKPSSKSTGRPKGSAKYMESDLPLILEIRRRASEGERPMTVAKQLARNAAGENSESLSRAYRLYRGFKSLNASS